MLSALLIVTSLSGAASEPDRAQRLAAEFIAPCCWSESAAIHRSPAAIELREHISAEIETGKTDDEIVEGLVAQYGERILITPRGSRANLLFWAPATALILGMGLVFIVLRRLRAKPQARLHTASGPQVEVSEDDLEW